MRPLSDWILVQEEERSETRKGDIILPEGSPEAKVFRRGVVIAMGPGRVTSAGAPNPVDVGQGQYILYFKENALDIEVKGVSLKLIHENEVIAVLDPDEAGSK